MRKIANILTKYKIEDSDMFNITNDENSLISGIPTLVVGWERIKELRPESNIIDWKTDDLTYWVFSKRENNSKYTERLKEFKDFAAKRFLKSINYSFFNILTAENKEKNEFFKKFINGNSFFLNNGEMLYSFNEEDNCVYGISLTDIDYEGKDSSEFLRVLSLNGKQINKVEDVPFTIKNF